MVNMTFSIPDDLKAEMDRIEEVSWSKVASNAIKGYLYSRLVESPQLEILLRDVSPSVQVETGPALIASLRVENRMPIEGMIDRVRFQVSLVTGSNVLMSRDGWHLTPIWLRANRPSDLQYPIPVDADDVIRTAHLVKQTLLVRAKVEVFVRASWGDFQQPYRSEVYSKLPSDDWQNFVANVKATYPWRVEAPGKS
jgi:hypothetical protein